MSLSFERLKSEPLKVRAAVLGHRLFIGFRLVCIDCGALCPVFDVTNVEQQQSFTPLSINHSGQADPAVLCPLGLLVNASAPPEFTMCNYV